jgi:putative DNA primase/helicase
MRRRNRGERIEPCRRRTLKSLAPLAQKCARWAADNDALRDGRPTMPDALDDRASDSWEVLLAIADRAGGEWPSRGPGAQRPRCTR